MRIFGRSRTAAAERPPAVVLEAAGLRSRDVLAHAPTGPVWLLAGRQELVVIAHAGEPGADAPAELLRRTAWVDLDLADWDAEEGRLTFVPSEPGEEPWTVDLENTGELLTVVRERLSATLVLERHAVKDGHRVTVVCRRRGPGGPLIWRVRYAEGVDPDDPAVRRAASRLLLAAQAETGAAAGDLPS